ncbi:MULTISPECIES: oxidase [Pseudomonas]|uniref:Oxidase n=1 Tax=Pseudomonas juntendi TaxID=2666183 RepID=A0A7W2LRH0_9PSED|nr:MULTISPECIES: oxidase [Pseudomonas]MBA6145718.1 oxidase [Pseudomonas juntendi]QEQ87117.1 oxidase [Pseudomonas putida]RRV02944.1 oxidase [Pseudomonas sp. p99-361]
MSILSVFHTASPALPHKVLTHHDDIAATLAEHGVRLEHAEPGVRVRPGTAQDEVLAACRAYLDQLMTAQGSKAFVLLNRDGQEPAQVDVRDEHVHDAGEVFAVISGRAQVGLRVGEWVYSVLCEKGDQLHVPAGTRRWVELGEAPFCLALRLYGSEQGAQARFTGDVSARAFLGIDEL